jgi:hypothetical protein
MICLSSRLHIMSPNEYSASVKGSQRRFHSPSYGLNKYTGKLFCQEAVSLWDASHSGRECLEACYNRYRTHVGISRGWAARARDPDWNIISSRIPILLEHALPTQDLYPRH